MSPLSTLLTPPPTRNHAPLPATGRAGRNLPAALGVAVLLIGGILASLLFYKTVFVGVVVVAVCGALWELAGAFARKGIRLPLAKAEQLHGKELSFNNINDTQVRCETTAWRSKR